MDTKIIDIIYESSIVPERWTDVLGALSQVAECMSGNLFITKESIHYFASSSRVREPIERFVREGWFWRGQIANRALAARHAGFLADIDLFTREELRQEPIYRDMWSQYGAGWSAMTALPLPTGENVCLVFPRRVELGPVERAAIQKLDALRPHLARSALLSAQLQLERAKVASETLAAIGLPAAVVDERGKVLAANSLFEALKGYLRWRAFDRIALNDKAADRLLSDAITSIDAPAGGPRSFPVRDAEMNATMVAHVVPLRLSARDIFVRCTATIVLTPLTAPEAPPVELVQSLFDLSPAEARVARELASGKTVDDIALDGGVATSTIRTQVRGVLEKTGCNRQAEVVALLSGISSARLG